MFNKKPLFSSLVLILLSILIFSNFSFAADGFRDVFQSHWANTSIQTMSQSGYVSGYPDGSFRPNDTISRAEFTSVVARISGLGRGNHDFTDMNKHWANGAIGAAVEAGVIVPSEYGSIYEPNTPITRLEIAKMTARALATNQSYAEILEAFSKLYNGDLPFVDYRDFEEENVPYLALAFATRIMGGYPDASFGQDRNATRAEAAVMLHSLLKAKEQEPVFFQYVNELKEITEIGMNATAVSSVEPQLDLTDPDTAIIEHPAFTAKLKRAYVIPLKGDVVSMYERKFLWDRNGIDPSRLENKEGYIVGVADVTFSRGGNQWNYRQHSLSLSSSSALFYYEPERRFGIESSVMEQEPRYEAGETYEISFYAYYNTETVHTRNADFKANGAFQGTEFHNIAFLPFDEKGL